jgi:hypothetical protein
LIRFNLIKERASLQEELESEPEEEEDQDEPGPEDTSEIVDSLDSDVSSDDDYCTRSSRDVVISGPLSTYKGAGRRFNTPIEALHWAQDKYGIERVSLVEAPEGAPRWAVLVKNLRA